MFGRPADASAVALFLPHGAEWERARTELMRRHKDELAGLLRPLEHLDPNELAAIGGARTSAGVAMAWDANGRALDALLPHAPEQTFELPARSTARANASCSRSPPSPSPSDYTSAEQLLLHAVRDWGRAGRSARRLTHTPVLAALPPPSRKDPLRVLVPGAGLCRLAWEIWRRGHHVEASDASAPMVVAAQSVLARGPHHVEIFPHVRCEGGMGTRGRCLRAHRVPDWRTAAAISLSRRAAALRRFARLGSRARLTLRAAEFADYGGNRSARFDALVTHYVIDTLSDPVAAVRRDVAPRCAAEQLGIRAPGWWPITQPLRWPTKRHIPQVRLASSLLVDHGLWINAGPLLWHEPSAGLLRLTSRELASLIRRSGFRLSTWRTMRGVPYVQGHGGHDVLFWVARRERRINGGFRH